MSNLLWKSLVVTPAVFGASILVSTSAIAATNAGSSKVSTTQELSQAEKQEALALNSQEVLNQSEVIAQVQQQTQQQQTVQVSELEKINRYSQEGVSGDSQSQVTSVSQFSDVQPTDWAFQALQSLVERYGCIAGYPNGTYRGNRAMTRYEFAAGLNACLDRVNELIATATADLVTKEDLATLQRLQEEFSAELATLRGRVDALEARTAELEANQFSTTTKLKGEAIFALTDAFGDGADDNNTVFQNRVRLGLETSFTGKDRLITRLDSGNAERFNFNDENDNAVDTFEGTQTFNEPDNGNDVEIGRLTYEVPVGPAKLYVAAAGGRHSHYAATNNPYFEGEEDDDGQGALSTFASQNPIYRIGGGAGAALNFRFGEKGGILKGTSLTLGYLASEGNGPGEGEGLFNGNYAALGQLNFNLSDRLGVAATYVHGYHGPGSLLFDDGNITEASVGSGPANFGGRVGGLIDGAQNPYSSNSYGLSAAFRASDKISISGFVSYTDLNGFGSNDDGEVWSYGAGVAFPDFGKQGNLLGIYAGAQPYRGEIDGARPYHIEGFYKYRVNDNVAITPGIIYLTAPGQGDDAEDAFIGTLRTTFSF
ncbi:iron uptake porin [Mastigocoleus sp. MO_188.B34]|uniref:iron uptake porin n=1 Tax=Mastigocoleus sp. MO_188.B34 TaxID=3036635 RepID=UPI0026109032|nr:iron uptake porin [Mastigocoleus sp. MO_188.B34]MDJ0698032.1 iron uptake porin [Mastigocoleus sp. MO_188.B34]